MIWILLFSISKVFSISKGNLEKVFRIYYFVLTNPKSAVTVRHSTGRRILPMKAWSVRTVTGAKSITGELLKLTAWQIP